MKRLQIVKVLETSLQAENIDLRSPSCWLSQVSANTENSSMSGYLNRSKGSKKQWKRLWFVIKNKVLYTYAASEVPCGSFCFFKISFNKVSCVST